MRRLGLLLVVLLSGFAHAQLANGQNTGDKVPTEAQTQAVIDDIEEPAYTPFVELYVLNELKDLRTEMAAQKVELMEKVLDRDLMVSDKAMTYSTNSVTYFFYLIAAVSTLLVIVGWTSIRDIKDKVHNVADKEVQRVINEYEKRLHIIEKQLTQKTKHIDENREAIEKTQEVHSLWLRAAQEHSSYNKIAIYDSILKLQPYDSETMTYKADAALDMGEPLWAKNLCYQVIAQEPEYGYAHFQLACANVALNDYDEAVAGLREALKLSASIAEEIRSDSALTSLKTYEPFQQLLAEHGIRVPYDKEAANA